MSGKDRDEVSRLIREALADSDAMAALVANLSKPIPRQPGLEVANSLTAEGLAEWDFGVNEMAISEYVRPEVLQAVAVEAASILMAEFCAEKDGPSVNVDGHGDVVIWALGTDYMLARALPLMLGELAESLNPDDHGPVGDKDRQAALEAWTKCRAEIEKIIAKLNG